MVRDLDEDVREIGIKLVGRVQQKQTHKVKLTFEFYAACPCHSDHGPCSPCRPSAAYRRRCPAHYCFPAPRTTCRSSGGDLSLQSE